MLRFLENGKFYGYEKSTFFTTRDSKYGNFFIYCSSQKVSYNEICTPLDLSIELKLYPIIEVHVSQYVS